MKMRAALCTTQLAVAVRSQLRGAWGATALARRRTTGSIPAKPGSRGVLEMRSDEQREQRDLPRHRPSSDSRMRKAILNPRTTGGQKFERPGSGSSRRITTVPKRDDSMSSDEMDYGPTMVPRAKTVTDGRWDGADDAQVKSAQRDAERLAKKLKAPALGEAGHLLSLSRAELESFAEVYGQPKYRGKQMFDAMYKHGVRNLEEMTQVPKAFREEMRKSFVEVGRSKIHHIVEAKDGTVKMLLQLADNRVVETVGIPASKASNPRLTVCVSSQVGCPMRCTFCATGKGGFARNLEPHEIADQVLSIQEHFQQRVSHVVFMGMGEPMLNIPSVLAAHRSLNEDLGIGARNITISTVGVPNSLMKLAQHQLQSTLAVSLHAANQELRTQLIPSAKVYSIDALLDDCHSYFLATKRRISFEYTLLEGVNDDPRQAAELARQLRKHHCASHINLIPWNPVDEADVTFARPSKTRINNFKIALEKAGITTSVRETRGLEAAAACGQLRNNFQKNPMQFEDQAEVVKV
mmetsp:Transcript_46777/g.87124  ORF Transcript_46777/g.87124 Transcript_46777/m.87124 type:complete len:522 (+) Transcript_46777:98-1663(+)